MPNISPIPTPTTPLVDKDGRMNRQWYAFFKALELYINSIP